MLSQPDAGPSSRRVRVIYIIGAGRSGSTVLDTVLGNHPDVVSVGELGNLPRSGWTDGEYCACGERADVCGFWTTVRETWQQLVPSASVGSYLGLRDRCERFGWRGWLAAIGPRARHAEYIDQTRWLLEAIALVSGRRTIVDSSKNPLRAMWLAEIPEIDLRLVHLVRDSRAVAWSRKKALSRDVAAGVGQALASRPAWKSVAYWTVVNLLSSRLRRRHGRGGVLVRYEDFVSDPATSLMRIGEACDLDCRELADRVLAGEAFPVGHTVAGNRLRMAGRVTLEADWDWVSMLPPRDRRLCWALSGWLLKQYDYPRQVRAA